MKWIPDAFAEQTMKKFGVTPIVCDVAMGAIDWDTSKKNGARLDNPIASEHVADLSLAMADGDSIPRPVLRLTSKGNHVVFSGNHRCLAAKENEETAISAYVIQSTDEVVLYSLPAALNAPMRQQSREDRVRLALKSIEKGMTVEKSSDVFSLPIALLKKEIRVSEFAKEMSLAGVQTDKIPKTHLVLFSGLKNPNVVVPAIRLAMRARMTSDEISSFAQNIRSARTESQQIAVVAECEKGFGLKQQDQSSPRKRSVATGVKIAITSLEKHCNVRTINQWGVTEKGEKIDFINRIDRLCGKLKDICKRSQA
jgi:hypothetical protein